MPEDVYEFTTSSRPNFIEKTATVSDLQWMTRK